MKQRHKIWKKKRNLSENDFSCCLLCIPALGEEVREVAGRKQLKLQIGDNWKFKYSKLRGNHFIIIIIIVIMIMIILITIIIIIIMRIMLCCSSVFKSGGRWGMLSNSPGLTLYDFASSSSSSS